MERNIKREYAAILKVEEEMVVPTLGSAFAAVLNDWLLADQMRKIVQDNASDGPNHLTGVCHSHDFCDANEAMMQAHANLLGICQYLDLISGDDRIDEGLRIFDAAWDWAKVHSFRVTPDRNDITEDEARTMDHCPGCGIKKNPSDNQIVCWSCFKYREGDPKPLKYAHISLPEWLGGIQRSVYAEAMGKSHPAPVMIQPAPAKPLTYLTWAQLAELIAQMPAEEKVKPVKVAESTDNWEGQWILSLAQASEDLENRPASDEPTIFVRKGEYYLCE